MITDSLGSPRVVPEEVSDESTWSYRLVDAFNHNVKWRLFIQPGLDTSQMMFNVDRYLAAYKDVDGIILQIGVVDCYPRALTKAELSIVTRLPKIFSNIIHWFVKKNYRSLVLNRGIHYVMLDDFRSNLEAIKSEFSDAFFLVVPIAPPSERYIQKNPKVLDAVISYNSVLREVFGDAYLEECYQGGDNKDIFLSDQHHLNHQGHEMVFKTISSNLRKLL